MKENRNAIYVTLVITTVALGLAIVFEYNEKLNELLPRADFIINCLLGIFSGSILALITAVINYRVERKRNEQEKAKTDPVMMQMFGGAGDGKSGVLEEPGKGSKET